MSKVKKRVLIIACAVILLIGVAIGAVQLHRHIIHQREVEAEMAEQRRIAETYFRLNFAFFLVSFSTGDREEMLIEMGGMYISYPQDDWFVSNRFGIDVTHYLFLKVYERETGATLSHDTMIEYFSHEFEPDGSLRLYNNGKHPEMEAYVEWVWEGALNWEETRLRELLAFKDDIDRIYRLYRIENADNGFERRTILELSPQMLDALLRAKFDPDYELDLISLQQAGY